MSVAGVSVALLEELLLEENNDARYIHLSKTEDQSEIEEAIVGHSNQVALLVSRNPLLSVEQFERLYPRIAHVTFPILHWLRREDLPSEVLHMIATRTRHEGIMQLASAHCNASEETKTLCAIRLASNYLD